MTFGSRVVRVAELLAADRADVERALQNRPSGLSARAVAVPSGVLVTLERSLRWYDPSPRSVVLRSMQRYVDRLRRDTAQVSVVAAAIRRGNSVLAAQRNHPPELAGRWEFAGGKVEAGEAPAAAIVRECREELAVRIEVTGQLERHRLDGRDVLILFAAKLSPSDQEPQALEHRELRWIEAAELTELDWLESNRPMIDAVRDFLAAQD
jgi:8-oxo-dGTP diphosphatase